MSFTFFSVGSVKVKFVEVPNEKVSAFLKPIVQKYFLRKYPICRRMSLKKSSSWQARPKEWAMPTPLT